jgi:hypothetical protein
MKWIVVSASDTGKHAWGPYRTKKEAKEMVDFWVNHWLSSGATIETSKTQWFVTSPVKRTLSIERNESR